MANSKKPSGLKITRNNTKFTFEWSLGETYVSQQLQYVIATSFESNGSPKYPVNMVPVYDKKHKLIGFRAEGWLWTSKSVTKGAKAASITVNTDTAAVMFRVRGKAKDKDGNYKNWSDYNVKDFIIKRPNTPTVNMSVVNDLTTSFSWSTGASAGAQEAFNNNQWQTALISNCEVSIANGNAITSGWSGVSSSGANGGATFSEAGWDTVANSFTRWVRVRAIGWCSFVTGWVYNKRVYASPKAPENVKATRSAYGKSGYSVTVTWDNNSTESRPTDSEVVSYVKTPPKVVVIPPSLSSGTTEMTISYPDTEGSWNQGTNPGNARGSRTASFIDSTEIPLDNCFFVKVTNTHDSHNTDSAKVLAEGGYGRLTAPSVPSESTEGGNIYTVSVQNRGTAISNAPIAVYFRTSSRQNERQFVGLIPPGESSTAPFKIPDVPTGDTFSFGVQAFVGNYRPSAVQDTTSPTSFTANMLMSSDIVWGAGVPLPPTVTAESKGESSIRVTWNQSWADATEAELSWSDHDDAWESTNEPQTYIVPRVKAGAWNISNLSVGTWYVRVRLIRTVGESVSYSAYSEMQRVKLSASPDIPSLLLSSNVIPKDGSVTCYWAYVSGDGTAQKQAQIFEAFPEYEVVVTQPSDNPYEKGYYELTPDGKYVRSLDLTVVSGKTYYKLSGEITYSSSELASTSSEQHLTLYAKDKGWKPGETHNLVVTVMSMSGEKSNGYSTPVPVTIADELTVSVTSSSLEYVDVPIEYDQYDEVVETRKAFALTRFPLIFNVSGVDVGSKLTCIIERAEPFSIMLPDETDYDGFTGDIVFMKDFDTGYVEIYRDDFMVKLDDTASYRVLFILKDAYGQSAETDIIPSGTYSEIDSEGTENPSELGWYELINEEYVLSTDTSVDELKTYYTKDVETSFEVRWEHQAVKATAIIETDRGNDVTMITPIQPEIGYEDGDVVDIYRLSADLPELIYSSAEFGTKYVDPYPAYGIFGGYRIVYRTYNGDYKTIQNEFAFTNYLASENDAYRHDKFGIIIDFGRDQLILPGNVSFSNSWSKDFTLTKYLGGSVQGDWNPAVERTMSANTTIPVEVNPENVQLIRKLADYPGICHIRTPDGSSFSANINVKDNREDKWTTSLSKITLDVTKCEAETNEGMTYDEWISRQ